MRLFRKGKIENFVVISPIQADSALLRAALRVFIIASGDYVARNDYE